MATKSAHDYLDISSFSMFLFALYNYNNKLCTSLKLLCRVNNYSLKNRGEVTSTMDWYPISPNSNFKNHHEKSVGKVYLCNKYSHWQ